MKSFVKFLITILVLAIIGYVVFYLIDNTPITKENSESGEIVLEENNKITSGEEFVESSSGDEYEEIILDESGEEDIGLMVDPKEESMKMIDEKVENINSSAIISTISTNISGDMIWENARSLIEYMGMNTLSVSINVRNGSIEIVPTSDFLGNQVFYFDENGNLILFENISNTVEGFTKYYFENGELLEVVQNYEEGINPKIEEESQILNRARIVFDKYAER